MRKYFIGAVVGVILAGATAALAAIPSADGTIHGCRRNLTGVLRVIDVEAGQQCQAGETALSWSQEGPQGEPGPPGISGIHNVDQFQDVTGPGLFTSFPTCPAGEVAIGGGYSLKNLDNGGIDGDTTVGTARQESNGYLVRIHIATDRGVSFMTRAVCATLES